ncbi:MAG TPA: glycosyltransferase, partial [Solirubrobacteraceae bacterium]|nr:glycosyltransferase [Solirubrobacteraceae bacterium]
MRIAMVNSYARVTGGADQHCLALADLLAAAGHHVSWLATRDDRAEPGGDPAREGVFVARTVSRASRQRLSPAAQLAVAAKALWNRDAERGMRELLARHRPDIVHVHKV